MKIPSKLDLEKFSVQEAIEYIGSLEPSYTQAPKTPRLGTGHTSTEVKEYASLLEQYEKDIIAHKETRKIENEQIKQLNTVLEDYIKDEAGLYDHVPKDKQDKVWSLAWQQGHSSGYSEIYNHLLDLVNLFE